VVFVDAAGVMLLAAGPDGLVTDDVRKLAGRPPADTGSIRAGFRGRRPARPGALRKRDGRPGA